MTKKGLTPLAIKEVNPHVARNLKSNETNGKKVNQETNKENYENMRTVKANLAHTSKVYKQRTETGKANRNSSPKTRIDLKKPTPAVATVVKKNNDAQNQKPDDFVDWKRCLGIPNLKRKISAATAETCKPKRPAAASVERPPRSGLL